MCCVTDAVQYFKKCAADLHVCVVYLYIFERRIVVIYVQGDWYYVLTITVEGPWEHFETDRTGCNTLPFRSNVCYS